MEGTVEDITLIVAKEIITMTIVKVTEVRAQEVCAKEVRATKETSMDVDVKEVTSIVSDSHMLVTTIGATPGQHLPSDITTVINLTVQILHRTTTSSTAPLQPLWPRTMLVTNSTRRQSGRFRCHAAHVLRSVRLPQTRVYRTHDCQAGRRLDSQMYSDW
jgi:hypothetical protein